MSIGGQFQPIMDVSQQSKLECINYQYINHLFKFPQTSIVHTDKISHKFSIKKKVEIHEFWMTKRMNVFETTCLVGFLRIKMCKPEAKSTNGKVAFYRTLNSYVILISKGLFIRNMDRM